jgi:hypothetical protein
MSNTTIKFAAALFLVLAMPAASFARGGSGSVATGHPGSTAGMGGFRPNPALLGADGSMSDPSGIRNASKIPPIPPPNMTVPAIPQFK